ncbi:hypothetical protein HH212_00050 [Massilia forsythiae]|uniref:XRE family transcriptional regulator n=1 Tax=Massilia forsythiae TaxID=2728020 RepID=A0A7Z2ZR17_9BURK|nr:hypothetical protein [Massilia forsythiae]QJD98629.1 hypothetical protein HH212_00050 [Massilia forsythiae]
MSTQADAIQTAETFNQGALLDALLGRLELKNDAALSRRLDVAPPVLSKIRHHRMPVGASLLIRMHEVTGLPTNDLRALMGDRRAKFHGDSKRSRAGSGQPAEA